MNLSNNYITTSYYTFLFITLFFLVALYFYPLVMFLGRSAGSYDWIDFENVLNISDLLGTILDF